MPPLIMVFQLDEIVRHVRLALGMNAHEPKPVFNDSPQLRIDQWVHARAPAAAAQVLMEAPLSELSPRYSFAEQIQWAAHRCWGWTVLPLDFLRLVSFQMDDWTHEVSSAITPEHPTYAMLHSPIAGVGGCPERPVCAIVPRSEGLVLEFYSCRTPSATVSRALYVPRPSWDEHLGLELPETLLPALIYKLNLNNS